MVEKNFRVAEPLISRIALRSPAFLTRKVSMASARAKAGRPAAVPTDYVLASGHPPSVHELFLDGIRMLDLVNSLTKW